MIGKAEDRGLRIGKAGDLKKVGMIKWDLGGYIRDFTQGNEIFHNHI